MRFHAASIFLRALARLDAAETALAALARCAGVSLPIKHFTRAVTSSPVTYSLSRSISLRTYSVLFTPVRRALLERRSSREDERRMFNCDMLASIGWHPARVKRSADRNQPEQSKGSAALDRPTPQHGFLHGRDLSSPAPGFRKSADAIRSYSQRRQQQQAVLYVRKGGGSVHTWILIVSAGQLTRAPASFVASLQPSCRAIVKDQPRR